ncbi:MAG: hypothetical protein EU531_03860 [Promethearchaeota archaeon]|nr:MAG: hypothetical protein EU531_03860 [Candidatus Lokiarchaeota archaeon]
MVKKDNRPKKINIKKERKRLIKEKRKLLRKQEKQEDKRHKTKLDIRLEKETKLYWIRAVTGALSALIGRLIGFIGWPMLIWMLSFWFLAPFFVNFVVLKYDYDKEEWNWKNIIKPGIGIFFLLFMIIGVITHTFLALL